jgi:hypothetical protein
MIIDWEHFTPLSALAGGALIGLAALLALCNGRIAGISGIVGGLLRPQRGDFGWRAAFVVGLLLAPLCWRAAASLPAMRSDSGTGAIVLAGLLVELGTRYGSGGTSGHGGGLRDGVCDAPLTGLGEKR